MEVRRLASVPPAAERYWRMKASRVSPTGLGRIINSSDAKMPMFGVGTQERRMLDAVDMGGTQKTLASFSPSSNARTAARDGTSR